MVGCGGSDSGTPPSQPEPDATLDDVADAGQHVQPDSAVADVAPPDVSADAPTDSTVPDVVEVDAMTDAGDPILSPSDIQYEAVAPIPSGEQLLFSDWNPTPNELVSIRPDGTSATKLFRVYRLWSFGAEPGGGRIAFSCGDPQQEAHYGIQVGDAIQHTWMYDAATESISLLSHGNINDECHTFGPAGTSLYVCRRYNFTSAGDYDGWRIGRIDLDTLAFEFLTPDIDHTFDLYPQPLPGETSMIFGRIVWIPPDPQVISVQQMALPGGTLVAIRTDGGKPALSPDATRYTFQKSTEGYALYSSRLDGTDEIKLSSANGTDVAWSPDGTRVAYLRWDNAVGCSHIEIVAADGSQATAPERVRDCSMTGEFIAGLAWIDRP